MCSSIKLGVNVFTKIILILGLIFTSSSFASQNAIPIENGTTKVVSEKLIDNNLKEKVELYKMLYENTKDANERLVSTVYMTIGAVITLLVALFSAQFLFNFKLKKEDIHNIKIEFDKEISNSNIELTKQINTLNNEKEKIFKEDLNLFKQEVSKNIDVKFTDKHKSIDLNFESCKKETELVKSNLEREMELMHSNSKNAVKNVRSRLKREIEFIDIKLEENIGDVWDLRGVKANALGRYITTAILKIKNDHEAKFALSKIIHILNEQLELDERNKNHLDELVCILPGIYESQKDAINLKLSTLRVYKYVDDPVNLGSKIEKTIQEAATCT